MSTALSRAVILGASGFIGRQIANELGHQGWEIVGHSSRTLDLMRPDALHALDGICGAEAALVLASALTPEKGQNVTTLMVNLTMAANVGRYLEDHPVGRCVYVSSDAVYGFDFNPVTEGTPVAPASYYALAKYAGERLLEYATASKNIPFLALRVAGVYGPGDPHSAYGPNAFARSLARDRTVRLFGNGEEERDHIYVDDAARLVAALVRSGTVGLLNLATGESRSFAEIVETIRGLVPYEFSATSAPRKSPITHRHYDMARLRRAVPEFQFTPFKEGLRATLAAFGAL
jgi:nucleoside-diphosphate-sugar epimerase